MEIMSYGLKPYSANSPIQAQKTSFSMFSEVSFGHKINADRAELHLAKGLMKLKNFSIAEYKTLSEKEKQALREEYKTLPEIHGSYFNLNAEKLHDAASYYIKSHLDEKYGEGKYAVITIGRSLSSIGKVLGYKIGEENVINIPMSRAAQYLDQSRVNRLKKDGAIDNFRNYLATQGLEKDKISSSEKHYVIIDYTYTGDSLRGAKKLLTRDDLLGDKNISAVSVNDCIKDDNICSHLDSDLMSCNYKDFSFVDTAPNLLEIPSAAINTRKADYSSQLMWFKLLDNQMTKPKEVSFQPKEFQLKEPEFQPRILIFWESLKNFLGLNKSDKV